MRIGRRNWMCLGWVLLFCPWISMAAIHAPLTREDRVRAQEAIERVYYEHRIWPEENPGPKPPFEQMISRAQIEAKVEDYLKKSVALDKFWQRPIQPEQLQAEMDRMAKQTQDPETLKELFAALDNDPYLIAECLARSVLADRLNHNWHVGERRSHLQAGDEGEERKSFVHWWRNASQEEIDSSTEAPAPEGFYRMPSINNQNYESGSWIQNSFCGTPEGRNGHTAVWTGSEMIIWGGRSSSELKSGGRYYPSTDSWLATSISGDCPEERTEHTVVWTGKEMIIWGGYGNVVRNSGGRYDPIADTWQPTSVTGSCPTARWQHTAVWTGSEMIVWGGMLLGQGATNAGARYDPKDDTWRSMAKPDLGGYAHTAVWTGTEMIAWGGMMTAGRRYSPSSNSWLPVSASTNCPTPRMYHTAIWTGTEMIIWGGDSNTGGRYNPTADSWTATSTGLNCPSIRKGHTAVWAGREMIIWGGGYNELNDGGRYNPSTDTWTSVATGANCPDPRIFHTAIWTGEEMIVWGGASDLNSGGRYDSSSDSWVPTFRGPSNRTNHTAVWTGVEMILWGGNRFLGTSLLRKEIGCRYFAATDSWSALPTPEIYSEGCVEHSALWTGAEMIIWGGLISDGSDPVRTNAGARYDPMTDTWTTTSILGNCPLKRHRHAAVWTGDAMIIWGGRDGDKLLQSGGRYFPFSDSWLPTSTGSNCATPRYDHSAAWSGLEMIIWGGYDGLDYPSSGGRYNAATDSWLPTSIDVDCPSGRRMHTAIWSGSTMIVWGGRAGKTRFHSGGQYDPLTNSWLPTDTSTQCPSPRNDHTAVWTGTEMIVWGGLINADFGDGVATDSGGIYNILTQEWTSTPKAFYCPSSRSGHSAIWTGSVMIVWGGLGGMASSGIYRPYSPHERPLERPE